MGDQKDYGGVDRGEGELAADLLQVDVQVVDYVMAVDRDVVGGVRGGGNMKASSRRLHCTPASR